MPDFSRWGANGGDPSLNAIARTDRYLDALASEQPVFATDPADAELANLMAGWRDDVRLPPAPAVATQRDAELVLQRAVGARRRTRMSMAVLGSTAAALLCLGGFGAVVYGAAPGDALYGLRTSLFGEQQVTRDDQVALAAQTEMQQVQQLIDQGDWTAAQDKLETITSTVQTVEDPQRQQELQQQLNQLTVKVETRDPDATVPAVPAGPGVQVPLPGLPPSDAVTLPSLPPFDLPGPGVPPDISVPQIPLPDGPKPLPVPGAPKPPPKPAPQEPEPEEPQEPQEPQEPEPAPKPAPQEPEEPQDPKPPPAPKPAPAPAPKPVEPAPVPEAPPKLAPAPEEAPATAPKPAPGLAPAPEEPEEEPPVEITTTIPPVPAQKPATSGD